jgi:hypothetical protein
MLRPIPEIDVREQMAWLKRGIKRREQKQGVLPLHGFKKFQIPARLCQQGRLLPGKFQ